MTPKGILRLKNKIKRLEKEIEELNEAVNYWEDKHKSLQCHLETRLTDRINYHIANIPDWHKEEVIYWRLQAEKAIYDLHKFQNKIEDDKNE